MFGNHSITINKDIYTLGVCGFSEALSSRNSNKLYMKNVDHKDSLAYLVNS